MLALRAKHRNITLITPFLTEDALSRMQEKILTISEHIRELEVVCSDWGLLQWLLESGRAEPIVGRLLVGQATDPRLSAFDEAGNRCAYERFIDNADGTRVALRYRRPTKALMANLRHCSIATEEMISFLLDLGIRRFEISNTLQGFDIPSISGMSVTLHVPEVPVAVARYAWKDRGSRWRHPSFPVDLCQRDNMVFYRNGEIPTHVESMGIDRIVQQGELPGQM